MWLDTLLLIIVVILALVVLSTLLGVGSIGILGLGLVNVDNKIEELAPSLSKDPLYQEAHYTGTYSHANIYRSGDLEYKIYPLCCPKCKAYALNELERAIKATKIGNVTPLQKAFTTYDHPKNNLKKNDYPYLVLVRPINDNYLEKALPKSINADSLTKLKNTIENMKPIDDSYQNIRLRDNQLILHHTDEVQSNPKTSVLEKINPDIFVN